MYPGGATSILTILNGGVCIFGDCLVDIDHELPILKAICDNLTHATIGTLSALILVREINHYHIDGIERITLIIMCTLVSSFIDLDHFVVAKSLKLSKATSINQRPFLHFTTIPILLMMMMFLLNQLNRLSSRWNLWLCILTCAFLTHHIRDATRRGFTIWPFGTTKVFPYPFYIVGIMLTPFALVKWLQLTTTTNQHRIHSSETLIV